MTEQDVYNAYAGSTIIEALLYENFDATPEWRRVKIKHLSFNEDGIEWIEVMILRDGWPTPWNAVIARDKFASDLREREPARKTVDGSVITPISDTRETLK